MSKKQQKLQRLRKHAKKRRDRILSSGNDNIVGLVKAFSKYSKHSVLSSIAGLSLVSDNHTQTIRLETASRFACCAENGKKDITAAELSDILNTYLPVNGRMAMQEDPIDNMFTDNIIYHGGNYIVYPGITEKGAHILQTLLNAIFTSKNELSDGYKSIISIAAHMLLIISSELAHRVEHSRYIESISFVRSPIFVPPDTIMSKYANAVIFSKDNIDGFLKPLHADHSFLKPFSQTHDASCFADYNIPSNPLCMKPFIEIDDYYILLQPSSICCALNHFIVSQANQLKITSELCNAINHITFANIDENLHRIGYSKVDYPIPPIPDDLPISEYLYSFDTNKLCYVQVVYDDLSCFKDDVIFDHCDFGTKANKIQDRHGEIAKLLLNSKELECEEILILVFLSGIGRSYFFGFQEDPPNAHRIVLSDEELEIFVKSTRCEKLCLWKYARCLSRLLDKYPHCSSGLSFLDLYSIYLDHHYSFTLSDEAYDMIFLLEFLGDGNKLRAKARKQIDTHAARFQNMLPTVHKQYNEGSIPIYFSEHLPMSFRLVEGFKFPVWIIPRSVKHQDAKVFSLNVSFSNMFAYWFWQISSSMPESFNQLPLDLLYIYFEFEDIDKWADEDFHDENPTDVIYTTSDDSICIIIPLHYKRLLHQPDNRGELNIIAKLLEALDDLCGKIGSTESTNFNEAKRQLDLFAESKYKKMLLMHTAPYASLYPNDLPGIRLMQENDQDDQLEGLAKLLSSTLPVGPIEPQKVQLDVLEEIVDIYLERIRNDIKDYDYKDLLQQFISNQEAIWHERAQGSFHLPARLACFGEEEDFIKKETNKFTRTNATSIALRFLIEFVSAEPPQGNSKISLDDYDKMTATSFELVNWATLYEQIEHGLFDADIDILPNGRVGRNREMIEEFKDVYISKKVQEKIDVSHTAFEEICLDVDEETQKTESSVNNALVAEFGMAWDDIFRFHNTLTKIGFERKTSCVMMKENDLQNELKQILAWSDEKIANAIDTFSLKNREKWEVPPSGYTFMEDIAPWRYKRVLSYIMKCLIRIKRNDTEPIVFWGPRHADESMKYIANLVGRGLYRARSLAMKKHNGEVQKLIGGRFNDKVYEWFKNNSDFRVEKTVKVNSFVKDDHDYGDIDILLVDESKKNIYSLECKYLYPARNAREMASEAERLFSDSEEKSWTTKHLERHNVIQVNLTCLLKYLKLPVDTYSLYSAVLTSEEIPSVYFSKITLKFINLMSLKRDGLVVLKAIDSLS